MQWWILLILPLVGAGCGQTPDDVVDEGTKAVDSWHKTLEMTCRQWAEYQVPTLYVKQTMKAGEEVLSKKLQDLEKLGSDQEAQRVEAKIHRLQYWVEQNQDALEKADGVKRHQILAALPREGEGP